MRSLIVSVRCLAGIAVIAASFVGCAKKEDDEMTEAEFCADYARRECAAAAPWCGFVAASCEPTRSNECLNRIVVWRNATGGARPFRAANADACLAKVTEAYSKFPLTGEVAQALNDTCTRVFQGTGKALESCAQNLDCDGTLICDKTFCADKKPVAAGGFCANPGETCVATEWCKASAASPVLKCSARQATGAACSATDPCLDSLRCTGTCVEKVAMMGACTQSGDCLSGYCSPYSQRCGVGLTFAEGSPSCIAFGGATSDAAVADAAAAD